MITVVLLITALCILAGGLYRSSSYGRVGFLSWLQSLVVALPWLLYFGLSILGIELSLVAILALLLASTGTYIWLGREMRELSGGQQGKIKSGDRASKIASGSDTSAANAKDFHPRNVEAGAPTHGKSTMDGSSDPVVQSAKELRENDRGTGQDPDTHDQPLPQNVTSKQGGFIPMPEEDLQAIKTIFGIDTFFSTEQTLYYNGAIFKGNLRGDASTVYSRLSKLLAEQMGTKYRLFMMDDPSFNPPKPMVVVLPSANEPTPSTRWQWLVAGFLFLVTVSTCMMAASIFQGFSLFENWSRWQDTVFLTTGIILVLSIHEIGHRVAANQHDVRLGPPFLLPTLQIGSFGGLTRIESVVPNRTALFDIGFSGPALGGGLSLTFLILGLILSHEGSLFQLSPDFFRSSILVGTLARIMLGNQLQYSLVDINPFVIVGWLGLLITAINLMPVGQLDGGRIVHAIYGRKILRRTSIITLLVLAIATFVNPLALYWMVVILLLQRQLDQPQLNELTEPDDTRAVLGLVALFLMVATLLPLSPELAARIGIGG
ncbi:MAG: site-2 protease family protein [Cyanobacteria bacterium P01_F01_bin.150]